MANTTISTAKTKRNQNENFHYKIIHKKDRYRFNQQITTYLFYLHFKTIDFNKSLRDRYSI